MNTLVKISKIFILCLILSNLLACAPRFYQPSKTCSHGQLLNDLFVTCDGNYLPLKTWYPPSTDIKAIIIALHGFNDYSHFFQLAGNYFSQQQIVSYAYDQRGFGASPNQGIWAGTDTYIADLNCFITLIRNQHPLIPIYLLGESMGAAIVIASITQLKTLDVNGVILAAPAVWARETMPWYQTTALWIFAHTLPWMTLTGEGMQIKPSDNIEILKTLARDPLVIKETRVDSIYGLSNLMDQAYNSARLISTNALILYGEKDEVIPRQPSYQFLTNLADIKPNPFIIAIYENGYHMLLRDLDAAVLWNDINSWIDTHSSTLPSGADIRAQQILKDQNNQ